MPLVGVVAVVATTTLLILAAILASAGTSPKDCRTPTPATVTVFVPAGPDVCRTESDCGADWDGTRWVIVPGEEE